MEAFSNIKNAEIGREAMKPYLDEICSRLSSGDDDLMGLAVLMEQAHDTEVDAYNLRVAQALTGVSKAAHTVLEAHRATRLEGKTISRTLDTGLAADVPEWYRENLVRMCSTREERALALQEKVEYEIVVNDVGDGLATTHKRPIKRSQDGNQEEAND